jgi:hypothetical protein
VQRRRNPPNPLIRDPIQTKTDHSKATSSQQLSIIATHPIQTVRLSQVNSSNFVEKNMKTENRTFAFQLSRRGSAPKGTWAARKGPAVAGCSEVELMNWREGDTLYFC